MPSQPEFPPALTHSAGELVADRPAPSVVHLIVLSTAGSLAMAVSSWWTAALPAGWHSSWPLYIPFYLGLTISIAAWLTLGHRVLDSPTGVPMRALRMFTLASAAPFLGAAPLGRDLWAYAAQGNLVRHGIDAYTHGPNALPGVFTDQMSARWIGSNTPYGPLWLQLSHGFVTLSHGHPTLAVLLLRLPAAVAIMLWLWALPILARRISGPVVPALWLGLASPLTIVLGFGGGHNDLLMIGLMLAGLAVATGPGLRRLAIGAAIVALAVMIKSPAAIAVAFAVPIWLHANGTKATVRNVIRGCAAAVVGAGISAAAVTLGSGLGIGWASQVSANAPWISWLSLPSGAIMLARFVTDQSPIKLLDATMKTTRSVAEALTVVLCAALWFRALKRAPVGCLAVALAAAALLAPAVQPWYYSWALALAGLAIARRPALIALAAVSIAFPIMITPAGGGLESGPAAAPILLASLLIAWFMLRLRRSATAAPTISRGRTNEP